MAHRFLARASLGTPRGGPHAAPAPGHARDRASSPGTPGFSVPDGSGARSARGRDHGFSVAPAKVRGVPPRVRSRSWEL